LDVTLYEGLLFAHLTFVAVWVGGDAMVQAFYLRAKMTGAERQMGFAADVEWIGLRVLNPSALLVVGFGVWLVLNSPAWEFSQTWVTIGLAMFLASALTGAFFLGPESGRISKLGAEKGPDDPDVQRRISRILWISRIELILLIAVIFDMVVKPGL
jgi:uncharacterized membrane protein